MREKAEFHVTTKNAGEADLDVKVTGPSKFCPAVFLTEDENGPPCV